MSIARTKYKVTKSLLTLGMLTTGLLSAFIGLVAFFGQYMGTFVISIDDDMSQIGITMSSDKDFTISTTRLLVNPIEAAEPTTFNDIDFNGIVSSDGDYTLSENNPFIGYTFYLKNDGNLAIDVEFFAEVVAATKNIDKVLRFMVIEDGYVDEDGTLTYAAANLYFKEENNLHIDAYRLMNDRNKAFYDLTNHFAFSDKIVTTNFHLLNFRPSIVKKYSIIIWLEGWDNDCNNSIRQGQLKMKLTFRISNVYEL